MFYEGLCKCFVILMCWRDSSEDYFINFVLVLSDVVVIIYCLLVMLFR